LFGATTVTELDPSELYEAIARGYDGVAAAGGGGGGSAKSCAI